METMNILVFYDSKLLFFTTSHFNFYDNVYIYNDFVLTNNKQ